MFGAILAGGVGTRLWPRSRVAQPKQFVDIIGPGRTLLQATTDRIGGLIEPDQMYVITGAQYVGLAAKQLPEIPPAHIVAEPVAATLDRRLAWLVYISSVVIPMVSLQSCTPITS